MTNDLQALTLRVARDVLKLEPDVTGDLCLVRDRIGAPWYILDLEDPAVIVKMMDWILEREDLYIEHSQERYCVREGKSYSTLWEALARLCVEIINNE